VSDLRFRGHGRRIGELLEEHDRLHELLAIYDAHETGEHTKEDHDSLNDAIRLNVIHLYELIGIPGMRGLFHVAMEMLDTAGHLGLPLDDDGDWQVESDGHAFMALVADNADTERLLALIAANKGKLPADHELAEANLTSELGMRLLSE
jgi:hypothetical protein